MVHPYDSPYLFDSGKFAREFGFAGTLYAEWHPDRRSLLRPNRQSRPASPILRLRIRRDQEREPLPGDLQPSRQVPQNLAIRFHVYAR